MVESLGRMESRGGVGKVVLVKYSRYVIKETSPSLSGDIIFPILEESQFAFHPLHDGVCR